MCRQFLSQYGQIKALMCKQTIGFRPSIYVEYMKNEECKHLIKDLNENDSNGMKRGTLGDSFAEIDFYFKKKSKPISLFLKR